MALLLFSSLAQAHEASWTRTYQNEAGVSCCEVERNCRPADVWVWSHARGDVSVDGERFTVPVGRLHAIPDSVVGLTGYLCGVNVFIQRPNPERARCIFYRRGNF